MIDHDMIDGTLVILRRSHLRAITEMIDHKRFDIVI